MSWIQKVHQATDSDFTDYFSFVWSLVVIGIKKKAKLIIIFVGGDIFFLSYFKKQKQNRTLFFST